MTHPFMAAAVVSFYPRPVPDGVWENKVTILNAVGSYIRSGRFR